MGLNTHADLKRIVPNKTLEKFLIEVAKEMGLSATSMDVYRTEYELGSVREVKKYVRTEVKIRGKILPLMTLFFSGLNYREGRSSDIVHICTGVYSSTYGFASKSLVEKYLSRVSEKINSN